VSCCGGYGSVCVFLVSCGACGAWSGGGVVVVRVLSGGGAAFDAPSPPRPPPPVPAARPLFPDILITSFRRYCGFVPRLNTSQKLPPCYGIRRIIHIMRYAEYGHADYRTSHNSDYSTDSGYCGFVPRLKKKKTVCKFLCACL